MRILVVEDELKMAGAPAPRPREEGHAVDVARTGDDAHLDGAGGRLRRDRPRPHAPGLDGIERLPALRARTASGRRCSCSRRATPSRIGSPGSTPARTTTCRSRSRSPSSSRGCARSCAGAAAERPAVARGRRSSPRPGDAAGVARATRDPALGEGVRAARDVHAPPRPGALAPPAPRARLGLRVREPLERRRRLRPLPAGEGRPAVRAALDRDGARASATGSGERAAHEPASDPGPPDARVRARDGGRARGARRVPLRPARRRARRADRRRRSRSAARRSQRACWPGRPIDLEPTVLSERGGLRPGARVRDGASLSPASGDAAARARASSRVRAAAQS